MINKTILILTFITLAFSGTLLANRDSIELVELKEKITNLEKQQKEIEWGTILPISAIALGALGLVYGLIQSKIKSVEERMLKQFETRLDEQITKTINDKKNIIDRTIGNTDTELRLMQTKRIFRIGEAEDAIVKKVLKNVGFNMQNYYTSEEEASKGFDVLFINNANGTQDLTELVSKVNNLEDHITAFYYNTNQRFFPSKDLIQGKEDKISFVNAASQIYGNLLNTLKYQDKLQQRQ